MSLQALREQRAAKAIALRDLVNKTEWNADTDQPIYDAGLAEIDDIDARIKRIETANARLAEDTREAEILDAAARVRRDKGADTSLFAKWLKGGDKALNDADWAAIRATMSTTTGSEGGFTVDSQVATQVLDALKAFGGMRAVATVIATGGIGPMSFPTSDGTSEEGELVPENTNATDADLTYGTISLPVYKFSSKVIAVPIELLQDSVVDIEAHVRERMVTRLGRITNRLFTVGTGSSQPHGIVTAAGAGVTAANGTSQVTAVTYDSLIDLQHSVDPAYRDGGRARFMMNDTSVRNIRKIKDGQSRPIFVPGYEVSSPNGMPDTLLGSPIVINQHMASMAASAKSILFGDFSHYYIRDAMGVEMFRFTDSAYAKKGQVGFLAWMRSGGNLIDVGGAVKAFVNAAS